MTISCPEIRRFGLFAGNPTSHFATASLADTYYIPVKRKVRIRTILGFCCTNLGSELWRNNPRIVHANIGSEDLLRKPQIHKQSSKIVQPNLAHPRQQAHDRSHKQSSSVIRRNEATTFFFLHEQYTDRARKAVRSSAAKKPRTIAHAKQLAHPRQLSTIDRAIAHALRLCRQRWLRINKYTLKKIHGWPRFGCAILDIVINCMWIRGLRSKICGSEVCAANLWI